MKKRRIGKGITFGLLATLLLAGGFITACKGKTEGEEALKRPIVDQVTIMKVFPAVVDEIFETTGTVRSDRVSAVASRAMGAVTSLLVQEGEAVRRGQLLLTIDDRDMAQRLQAATMAAESARHNKELAYATWRRYKNLFEEKALSRQEMDQIETQKKVAEAEQERATAMVEEARAQESFARVKAPVAGRIMQKRIAVGSMAMPGIPLIIIEESGSYHVEAALDERLRNKIKVGMAAEVMIEDSARPLAGSVRQILPAIDSLSRTFTVKIIFPDRQSLSGLFVRVKIPVGKKEVILVPEKAIVQKGQLTGVYAVDERGFVTYRLIRTGLTYGDKTEIISGLASEDRVITGGVERAKDGGIVAGGTIR